MTSLTTVLSATSYVLSAALPFSGLYNNASASISEEQPYVMDGVVSFGKDDPSLLTKPTTSRPNQFEAALLHELQQTFKTKLKKTDREPRQSTPDTSKQGKGPGVFKSVTQKTKAFNALPQQHPSSTNVETKDPNAQVNSDGKDRIRNEKLPNNAKGSLDRIHKNVLPGTPAKKRDPVYAELDFSGNDTSQSQEAQNPRYSAETIYSKIAFPEPAQSSGSPTEPIYAEVARDAKHDRTTRSATESNKRVNENVNRQPPTEPIYAQPVKRTQKNPDYFPALRRSQSLGNLSYHSNQGESTHMTFEEYHDYLRRKGEPGLAFILLREARAAKHDGTARLATESNEPVYANVNTQPSTQPIYAQVEKRRQKNSGQGCFALERFKSMEKLTSDPDRKPSPMSPQPKKPSWRFWKW